ncbi:MLO-like protein 12 [Datura stramonium]|uniref:MLO-like protein 12 n=1 Tax=Datura stramonium TaxID=4076 RepID=A0ABS8SEV7_DATST|nr:MLO-like protein 12 [Datura stramonium]
MGLRIQERGEVVKGVPVVQPGDDLFWFNRPRLLLYLINFVLFQNAFQLAFFAWTWYEFGLKSCFHDHTEDIVIRMTMGIEELAPQCQEAHQRDQQAFQSSNSNVKQASNALSRHVTRPSAARDRT